MTGLLFTGLTALIIYVLGMLVIHYTPDDDTATQRDELPR